MTLANEKRRLAEIIAAVQRNRNGGLDLSRLTDDQRDSFDRWQRACKAYAATFNEPDAAYAAMIEPDGSDYPRLRRDVHCALFGDFTIFEDDTTAQASEKYQRMIR